MVQAPSLILYDIASDVVDLKNQRVLENAWRLEWARGHTSLPLGGYLFVLDSLAVTDWNVICA
jgi:hypothetical protein